MRHNPREERGQGLVEYALMIALVGLASVIALGFLSGKINTIFSKAGNVLNNTALAAGGGPGGGSLPGSVTNLPSQPGLSGGGVWAPTGSASNASPGTNNGYSGMQGVYSESQPSGVSNGSPCSFTINGVVYQGYWVNHNNIPGSDSDWIINGVDYDWACLPLASNSPPANGTATITPAGPVLNITTTTPLTANANSYTGATWYDYDWERTGSNVSTTCSGFSDSNISDSSTASATDVKNADAASGSGGANNRCFRVTITARNAFGTATGGSDTSNEVRVSRTGS